jgi:hypothetical protein
MIGRHNLRRYYTLILFQAYLNSITLNERQNFETFEHFIRSRPGRVYLPTFSSLILTLNYIVVLETFEKDFFANGDAADLLEPVNLPHKSTHPDQVQRVLAARSGAVLGPSTILKSDYFSGLEKLSLPE